MMTSKASQEVHVEELQQIVRIKLLFKSAPFSPVIIEAEVSVVFSFKHQTDQSFSGVVHKGRQLEYASLHQSCSQVSESAFTETCYPTAEGPSHI